MSEFTQYRRKQIAELKPWTVGDDISRVSISAPDKEGGSPKAGDMIARNPKNHDDMWLVAAAYFADNFEPVALPASKEAEAFQARVQPWMMACFGAEISGDKVERGDRLLEEVLELLQSGGYDPARVSALRDYVWARPSGEPAQEVGGVVVTLAAYCLAHDLDMHSAGETELARIWTKVEKIRAKQAAKPVGSALPIAHPPTDAGVSEAMVDRAIAAYAKSANIEASLEAHLDWLRPALRAALSTAIPTADDGVPPGMVLVPREPTEAMQRDGCRAIQDWEDGDPDGIIMDFRWLACWKAMIEAALSTASTAGKG